VEGHTIEFVANVFKVQTLSENQGGGLRVTLDLPETEIIALVELAECQRFGVVLQVACKTEVKQYALAKGTKRKSAWKTAQETNIDGSP
jgi:hypothetical protein